MKFKGHSRSWIVALFDSTHAISC